MLQGRKIYLVVFSNGPGIEIAGKDILQRAMEPFAGICPGLRILTVMPGERIPDWRQYCIARSFYLPQSLVPSAFTPFHSMRKALEKIPEDALVIYQDGARPFPGRALLEEMLRRADGGAQAVVPCLPSDAPVLRSGSPVPVPAEETERILTPQVYDAAALRQAYSQPYNLSFLDPAIVVAAENIPLTRVTGERWNLKVSSPEDLALARSVYRILTDGNS